MSTDAKVCGDHFHLQGVDYFRGHAEAVQLGDAGSMRAQGGGHNGFAVLESLPRHKLVIGRATQIDLHRVAISGSDIGAGITVPGVGALGAATLARQLEDEALALVKLECLPHDLVAAANDSPAVLAALLGAGDAGRLVHQVFVILEMKTALNFTRSTRFEPGGSAESWAIAGVGSGSRTVVAMSRSTTFAYLLLRAPRAGPAQPAPRGGSSCPAEPDQLERAPCGAHRPQTGQRIDDWADEPWRPDPGHITPRGGVRKARSLPSLRA